MGWLGAGEEQHIPTPASSLPSPVSSQPSLPQALSMPRLTTIQRSHTALGQGEAKRFLGHPNIFQIWGSEPKLEPDLLQVTQPGGYYEPEPGPQGLFLCTHPAASIGHHLCALTQQPL